MGNTSFMAFNVWLYATLQTTSGAPESSFLAVANLCIGRVLAPTHYNKRGRETYPKIAAAGTK